MRILTSPNNPSRDKLHDFVEEASLSLPANSLILDAGAGEGMYRHLFTKMRYVSIDLCKVTKAYGRISAISDLAKIPFQTNCFDGVVCTQVLEHVNDPTAVLAELNRVLKPSGALWLSAPFFYEQHEIPYDYFRYTQYGLTHLLEKNGFHVNRLEWLEGYYGALAYQLTSAARYYSRVRKNYLFLLIFKLLAHYFNAMEIKINRVEQLPPGYYGKNSIAVAIKIDTTDHSSANY